MARLKKIVAQEQVKHPEEKLDYVFRIFAKTNPMRGLVVVRIELPNNEVHEKNHGNMPVFGIVIPYVGHELEYYVDDKFIGMRRLTKADGFRIKLEEVVSSDNS